jgi:hypothetical protein
MPQGQLPFFPHGFTEITNVLVFKKEDGKVTYLNGLMPVFVHDEQDQPSFRMITAQFCVNGFVKQAEIVRAFGVTAVSVRRSVKLYREQGACGFFKQRRTRGAAVLTPDVLEAAQQLFDEVGEIGVVQMRVTLFGSQTRSELLQ